MYTHIFCDLQQVFTACSHDAEQNMYIFYTHAYLCQLFNSFLEPFGQLKILIYMYKQKNLK